MKVLAGIVMGFALSAAHALAQPREDYTDRLASGRVVRERSRNALRGPDRRAAAL